MAKIVNKKISIEIELDQDEIDSLYHILDMFYNESNYKRWAHRLSQLRKEISPHVNDIAPKLSYPKLKNNDEDTPF